MSRAVDFQLRLDLFAMVNRMGTPRVEFAARGLVRG